MSYTYSAVLITPADQLETANKVSVAIGHGLNNFTLPASSDGTNVTHYYCHAWCNEVFDGWVNGIASGQPPEGDWEGAGLTLEEAMLALSRMIVSCRDGADPQQHVDDVLHAYGLVATGLGATNIIAVTDKDVPGYAAEMAWEKISG